MIWLLDANVLIALGDVQHVHHELTEQWFASQPDMRFATCPITQGSLVRHLFRQDIVTDGAQAQAVLGGFVDHPAHEFWPENLSYADISMRGVIGHRQVTDAYLAALARNNGGRLATLDKGLAALQDDVTDLIC